MGRPAVLVLLLGACLSKPERPLCGDGLIQADERCDDGNTKRGDGCSETCTMEPWFVCPRVGEPCHPVLALQWTAPGAPLPGIGGLGGGDFEDDCRDVAGLSVRSAVIVGFSGGSDPDGSSLTDLHAICADVELRDDGGIRWRDPMPTPSHGNTSATPLGVQMCDEDEVATGFIGTAGGVASGFQLACQAPSHADGTLSFGTPRRLPAIGPNNQTLQEPQSCPELEVARAVVGKSGAVIDRFSLRCVPTAMVICGDGVIDEPETCDDGNAIPRDGCNETCMGD